MKTKRKLLIIVTIFCIVVFHPIGAEDLEQNVLPYVLLYYWDIYSEVNSTFGVHTESLFTELELPMSKANILRVKTLLDTYETPLGFAQKLVEEFQQPRELE